MDKTDKCITDVSFRNFLVSPIPQSCLPHSQIYHWCEFQKKSCFPQSSIWIFSCLSPAWHIFSLARNTKWIQSSFQKSAKFLWCHLWSLKKSWLFSCVRTQLFFWRDRTPFSSLKSLKTKKMWAICVASISWEICLSYLGKVFGNLDVVFVNSTGTSCRPKTNQVFLNLNQMKYLCFFSSHLDKISVFVSSTFMEKDNTEPP